MANIGMMEGAYFVGRVELLQWLNDLLQLDYTKVEQTASGAAHCQIMDAIYPGQIALAKVNFNAKHEYEFVKNFKILQNAFDKLGLDKAIDVDKLVKAKYQDNLEFLQWIKRYYDLNNNGEPYNALERRKYSYAGDKKHQTSGASPAASGLGAPKRVAATKAAAAPAPKAKQVAKPAAAAAKTTPTTTKPKEAAPAKTTPAPASGGADDEKVQELEQTVAELKNTVAGLEKERDFYFGKLRDIEILCQNGDQESDLVKEILKILYLADEEEGFVSEESAPQEEDEIF